MIKRILGVVMAGIVTATAVSVPSYAENTVDVIEAVETLPYLDVADTDWYYTYVYDVYEKGIMTGLNEYIFAPDNLLVRAQFATLLYRYSGSVLNVVKTFPVMHGDIFWRKRVRLQTLKELIERLRNNSGIQ